MQKIRNTLSYIQRYKKEYKAPYTNAKQTPDERNKKYKELKELGFSAKEARKFRDCKLDTEAMKLFLVNRKV
jgi:hypothetical protein